MKRNSALQIPKGYGELSLGEVIEIISRKPLLDEQEAALYMGRSVTAMRELRYCHKVAYIQDGRTIRYRRSDLDRYNELKLIKAV